MRTLIIAIATLAFLAAPAMAQLPPIGGAGGTTYGMPVNVTVAPTVGVWAGAAVSPTAIPLALTGANAENSVGVASAVTYLSNVTTANISAQVDGVLPAPIVPGGGINFFIFNTSGSVPTALAAIVSNAYNPAGALVWTNTTLGTSQPFATPLGVASSAVSLPIVYAASAPGELPAQATFNLVVTYTIAVGP